ncbi:LDLR chaperone boca isoform X2 [Agrilus planipennis]|uniref:LDLR chaperone boca isoform X1 n=1 Tax=Agrilus planipennis TaxID=224129 RepID=A0A7F5R496_AGRPL|nr:LDLR chaperone boca isoform X1 [Agrilus planipennis]XP_025830198.1 LDLR chaperone boca isoform X2 [Agrilus planipennis]
MKNFYVLILCICTLTVCKKFKEDEKPEWAKKDVRDFTDADLEHLLDQWEEDEEPLPEDELPEYLKPQQPIDFNKIGSSDPEKLLQLAKKGRTLMTFVSVSGNPKREETEELTKLWQTSLWNNHIQAERYLVDDNRAIFMYKDGSQAWTAKDYLIEQEKCESVTIESKVYPGKYGIKRHLEDEL